MGAGVPNSRSPTEQVEVLYGIAPHCLTDSSHVVAVAVAMAVGLESESHLLLPWDGCCAAILAARNRAFCAQCENYA